MLVKTQSNGGALAARLGTPVFFVSGSGHDYRLDR